MPNVLANDAANVGWIGMICVTLDENRLLIPLNVCRKDTFYLPWKCEDERHVFEKCVISVFISGVFLSCGGFGSSVYILDLLRVLVGR